MLEQRNTPAPKARKQYLLWIVGIVIVIIGVIMMNERETGQQPSYAQTRHTGPTSVIATITNSGSTNLPGATLTIKSDGSGALQYEKGRGSFTRVQDRAFPSGTFDNIRLASLLAEIKDVSLIPDHNCIKSVSFGSTTTITYKGRTSGDLSCLSHQDGNLFMDLRSLVENLYTHASSQATASEQAVAHDNQAMADDDQVVANDETDLI